MDKQFIECCGCGQTFSTPTRCLNHVVKCVAIDRKIASEKHRRARLLTQEAK